MNKTAKKVSLVGILCAQALVLSWLESLLPAFPWMPPGAKPGFSNIVTMFAAGSVGISYALLIAVVKAGFAFITRGVTAGFMSLAGGIVSTLMMYLLLRKFRGIFGLVGISVICALCHNAAQLCVAAVLTGTGSIMMYAPVLLIFAVITGCVTGVIFKAIIPILNKQSKYFIENSHFE